MIGLYLLGSFFTKIGDKNPPLVWETCFITPLVSILSISKFRASPSSWFNRYSEGIFVCKGGCKKGIVYPLTISRMALSDVRDSHFWRLNFMPPTPW